MPWITFVSILVFVELALDGWVSCLLPRCAGFQSLFSWNLLLMTARPKDPAIRRSGFNPCFRGTCSWWQPRMKIFLRNWRSFNPCFRGTCSWCPFAAMMADLTQLFQSLFSWNLLLMHRQLSHGRPRGGVSILVFVELALDGCEMRYMRILRQMFQSLFSWNLLLMREGRRCCQEYQAVSILVFVELALDDLHFSVLEKKSICFNPCFRGTCSWWAL